MNPQLAQKIAQEIGQLVYLGHAVQVELDQANARIAELEARVKELTSQPTPENG